MWVPQKAEQHSITSPPNEIRHEYTYLEYTLMYERKALWVKTD